jgi:putative membrane protein
MSNPTSIVPSSKYLLKLYIGVLSMFFIFVFPWILLGLIPSLGWLYVLIFVVANALWLVPTLILLPLYVKSLSYELGDDELIVRSGVVTKSVKTIPYRTITDFTERRGFLDRWLGIGSLGIQTAGQSVQGGNEGSLVGLTDWSGVREELVARLRRDRAGRGVGTEVAPSAPATADAELLRAILAEVKGLREDLARR